MKILLPSLPGVSSQPNSLVERYVIMATLATFELIEVMYFMTSLKLSLSIAIRKPPTVHYPSGWAQLSESDQAGSSAVYTQCLWFLWVMPK